MGDTKKIGVRVDAELWKRFIQYVEDKHNRKQTVTAIELEKALRAYLEGDNAKEPIHRIENDVTNLNRLVAEIHDQMNVEADGWGVAPAPSPSNGDDTHTDDSSTDGVEDRGDEKPHPKSTVDERVEWLIDDIFSGRESGAYVRADLIDAVRKRYSLSDDAVERLADAMLTKVGAKDTPQDNDLLAWGEKYRSFKEQAREQARQEADDVFADLEDAETGSD